MGYIYKLPKDTKQAADVVANLVIQGKARRNPEATRWWVSNYYMRGLREFSNLDYSNGTVSVAYLNESGLLKLRYEEIVSKYQTQLGRLMAIDMSPAVRRKGVSLDGTRKSSVAQVVLDAAISQDKVSKLKLDLLPPLLLYGTVGVGLWVDGSDSQGVEVIMPWELLPIPMDISGPTDVRGVMRVRFVPTEWVKNLTITPSSKAKAFKNIDEVKLPSGNMPIDVGSLGEGILSMSSTGGGFFVRSSETAKDIGMASGHKDKKNQTEIPITQVVEVWTETSDGYLAEYAIYAGLTKLVEVYRHNHTQEKYHMPIRIIRDVTVGSFWGRSYVDQLIPLNNELEIALSSIFQSVADFDLYGLQLWPATLGTPQAAQRGQDGLKRIVYEPDYTSPELRIENVMPAKMTAPQLQAVQLASSLMDKLANQPNDLLSGQAPGRVDSGPGLGLLYETSGIPLSPVAKNIAEGISGIYRALLRILKDTWTDQKVVNISSLDDSLAGIVLDAESGTLSLSQNAIPFPDEVSVTIASEVPVSKEQQKLELKEALAQQRITLDEFNFEVRKRGLDIPVGGEFEWQNYRRAMLENILLFGDGITPNPKSVIISDRDSHRIHEMVLNNFMSRPEFFTASPAVRDAFAKHWEDHHYSQGAFPDQLPYPETQAEAMMGMPPQEQMMGG